METETRLLEAIAAMEEEYAKNNGCYPLPDKMNNWQGFFAGLLYFDVISGDQYNECQALNYRLMKEYQNEEKMK